MKEILKTNHHDLEVFSRIYIHGLKDPLQSIANFAQQLYVHNAWSFDDKSTENILHIFKNINQMKSLIQSMLSYSQIKNKKDEYCDVDLNQIVNSIKKDFDLLLHDVQGSLQIDPLPKIWAHPIQIHKLFTHIISNAIKFRNDEPLSISISATESKKMWKLNIKYNGIGFDKTNRSSDFDIFNELNATQSYKDSCARLFMCKSIVEAHNGEIKLFSNISGYCEFKINLPK